MEALTSIARHRQVIAAVADAIVAAAGGGGLRVTVDGEAGDTAVFADRLTQALHVRGRDCRCLLPEPGPLPGAVVIDGRPAAGEGEPCQVHVRVVGAARGTPAASTAGARLRIVVDYVDPGGPVIRHIEPPCPR